MGSQNSQESKYSIDIQIDKSSYQIYDTLYKGMWSIQLINLRRNMIWNYHYKQIYSRNKFNAEYQQQYLENVGGGNTFIWRDEILKICSKEDLEIHEKASFQFNLDLISTTAKQDGWFFVRYYINACIRHRFRPHVIYLLNKDIDFQVHRPYVSLQRPIYRESINQIKTIACCNYGQIQLKVSLDEQDFQMNDVAEIKIDCDQTLSTRMINQFRINFLSRKICRDNRNNAFTQHIFNTIFSQGLQSKQYQLIQYLKLDFQEDYEDWFHSSLECPNFTHNFLIQIVCNTGLFANDIILEIPIILYHTQLHQLKFYCNIDQINRNSFNQDTYLQFKSLKFIELNIKQENWKDQSIDFPQNQQVDQIQEIQLNNNQILIQSNQK